MYESRLLSFGTAGSKDRLSFLHNERIRGKIILINMILEDDEMKIIENSVTERFLRYISYDTQSKEEGEQVPSTTKQLELGKLLTTELKEMGVANVRMDEHGYIYGEIPANTEEKITSLGFIAHMDTSPALSGKDVKPQFVENYDGGDILFKTKKKISGFLLPISRK